MHSIPIPAMLNDGSLSNFLSETNAILEKQLANPDFSIDQLCRQLCLCRMQLHRKLKAETGLSATHFIRRYRLKAAEELLTTTERTISEIAYDVGFSSPSYFTRSFVRQYGLTPTEYRHGDNPSVLEKMDEKAIPLVISPPIVTIVKGIVTQVQRRLATLI